MSETSLYKYHGLGNDFLIAPWPGDNDTARTLAVSWCDRHRGIGADGVLYWLPLPTSDAVQMMIYNQDGSRPEMCGNGVRCLALFLIQHGHLDGPTVEVHSDAGVRMCHVDWNGQVADEAEVTVDMGAPESIDGDAPFGEHALIWHGVDMGNPHAVVFEMPELDVIEHIGAMLNGDAKHSSFPNGVNVSFATRRPDEGYDVVVYERGVGRTQACGTAACAVAWAAWTQQDFPFETSVPIYLPGGRLELAWKQARLWMTGPAQWTFTAQWPA